MGYRPILQNRIFDNGNCLKLSRVFQHGMLKRVWYSKQKPEAVGIGFGVEKEAFHDLFALPGVFGYARPSVCRNVLIRRPRSHHHAARCETDSVPSTHPVPIYH